MKILQRKLISIVEEGPQKRSQVAFCLLGCEYTRKSTKRRWDYCWTDFFIEFYFDRAGDRGSGFKPGPQPAKSTLTL